MYTNNAQSIQMLNDFRSLSQLLKATTRVCVCATYFDLDSEVFVCLQVKLWLDGLSESRVHRKQCTYLGAGRDKSTKMIFGQIQIQKYRKYKYKSARMISRQIQMFAGQIISKLQ